MSSAFERIMARRRGETVQGEPEQLETEGQLKSDLPMPLKILLGRMGIDPNAIFGHLKQAEEMITQKVESIESLLKVILEAQARQMGMLNLYNDTLILCLQRLTEIESNQRLTPIDEFGELDGTFADSVSGVAGGMEQYIVK